MEKKQNYGFPDGLIVITPNDPTEVSKGAQSVHVGLNISGIYGEEAELQFARFRMHISPGRLNNSTLAKEAFTAFIKISGISPMDILETINEVELSYGFTTLRDH